jgi:hypothetical protein
LYAKPHKLTATANPIRLRLRGLNTQHMPNFALVFTMSNRAPLFISHFLSFDDVVLTSIHLTFREV